MSFRLTRQGSSKIIFRPTSSKHEASLLHRLAGVDYPSPSIALISTYDTLHSPQRRHFMRLRAGISPNRDPWQVTPDGNKVVLDLRSFDNLELVACQYCAAL